VIVQRVTIGYETASRGVVTRERMSERGVIRAPQ